MASVAIKLVDGHMRPFLVVILFPGDSTEPTESYKQ